MSELTDRANRLQEMFHTAGWMLDAAPMLHEIAETAEGKLKNLMAKSPDTLTGKTALKYAIRANALRNYLEELQDAANFQEAKP